MVAAECPSACVAGIHPTRKINPFLIESFPMRRRLFFRWILPAIAGLIVGVLALPWASTNESSLPVFVVAVVSPGLKIAELIMPARHESLAWTFGWFLRIAIGANVIFYFAIFALLAHLASRWSPSQ
jgi:hypothetical protein